MIIFHQFKSILTYTFRFYTINGSIIQGNQFDPSLIVDKLSNFGIVEQFYFSQETFPTETGRYKFKSEVLFSNSWTIEQQDEMYQNLPLIPGNTIIVIK